MIYRLIMILVFVISTAIGYAQDTVVHEAYIDDIEVIKMNNDFNLKYLDFYDLTDSLADGKWILYNVKRKHKWIKRKSILIEAYYEDNKRNGRTTYYLDYNEVRKYYNIILQEDYLLFTIQELQKEDLVDFRYKKYLFVYGKLCGEELYKLSDYNYFNGYFNGEFEIYNREKGSYNNGEKSFNKIEYFSFADVNNGELLFGFDTVITNLDLSIYPENIKTEIKHLGNARHIMINDSIINVYSYGVSINTEENYICFNYMGLKSLKDKDSNSYIMSYNVYYQFNQNTNMLEIQKINTYAGSNKKCINSNNLLYDPSLTNYGIPRFIIRDKTIKI